MVWVDLEGFWSCRTMDRVERVRSHTEPIGTENSKFDSRGFHLVVTSVSTVNVSS